MKLIPMLVAAAGLSAGSLANAAPVTLDFENQTSFASLNLAENAYGFTANGALLALANDGLGTGASGEYFSNNPSGSLVMFATDPLPGETASLTSSLGFASAVSFAYSASAAGTIFARDALGAVIGSFDLVANSVNASAPFSFWSLGTLSFTGLAHSIDFSGVANIAAFDNVTVNPVPLPAAGFLLPFGLAALRLVGRKRAA